MSIEHKKNSGLVFLSSADPPAPTPQYVLEPTFVDTVMVFFISVTTSSRTKIGFFHLLIGGGPGSLAPPPLATPPGRGTKKFEESYSKLFEVIHKK